LRHDARAAGRVRPRRRVNIRPHDLVRLRRTPEWIAVVMVADDELALVEHWVSGRLSSTRREWAQREVPA
jgi:hypothetical protein